MAFIHDMMVAWCGRLLAEVGLGPLLLDAVDVDIDFFVVEAELCR